MCVCWHCRKASGKKGTETIYSVNKWDEKQIYIENINWNVNRNEKKKKWTEPGAMYFPILFVLENFHLFFSLLMRFPFQIKKKKNII